MKQTFISNSIKFSSLCMGSDNERRRYIVKPPIIGWTHAKNDPCLVY